MIVISTTRLISVHQRISTAGIAIFGLSLWIAELPAQADFGPAEVQAEKAPEIPSVFDAWCVEKYADCTVEIEPSRIRINNGEGVTREKLVSWEKRMDYRAPQGVFNLIGPHQLYSYFFEYKTSNGSVRRAAVVFQHSRTSDLFSQRLRKFAPEKEVRCNYNFDLRETICQ